MENEKPKGNAMEKLATLIVDKRNLIFLLYIFALIFCVIATGWVNVENDITTYLPEETDWTDTLRRLGFTTAAMALRQDSLRLDDPRLLAAEKLAVVLGTEGDGLADGTIAQCDHTVMIPMTHGVDSLNVAAAAAVAFYQLGLMCQ